MSDSEASATPGANLPGIDSVRYGPQRKRWSECVPEWASVASPADSPYNKYPLVPEKMVRDLDKDGDLPVVDCTSFEIPPTGLTEQEREEALGSLRTYLEALRDSLGFQIDRSNYSENFAYLMDLSANNYGDPFSGGRLSLNTKFCERSTLDYFAALWNLPWPHDRLNKNGYWGYISTMGFTECNIQAIFRARNYLRASGFPESFSRSGACGPCTVSGHERQPVLFYSDVVQYSVKKAGLLLDVPTFGQVGNTTYPGQCPIKESGDWCNEVPTHRIENDPTKPRGSIDLDALAALVEFFVHRGYPVIVVATLGTTWEGAHDDVAGINSMFCELGKKYPWLWERKLQCGFKDGKPLFHNGRGFWFHVDGALGGAYLPFLEMACKRGDMDRSLMPSVFDFRNPALMSMGCSIHKWIGNPVPAGVFMTRNAYKLEESDELLSMLAAPDSSTMGGSRSAVSPVLLWDFLSRNSYADSVDAVVRSEEVLQYLHKELRKLEVDFGIDLWIARSHQSFAIRFRQVNELINYKWGLDTRREWVAISESEQQLRSYSHIFVMKSVDKSRIDRVISEIREAAAEGWENAFPTFDVQKSTPNPGPCKEYVPIKIRRDSGVDCQIDAKTASSPGTYVSKVSSSILSMSPAGKSKSTPKNIGWIKTLSNILKLGWMY